MIASESFQADVFTFQTFVHVTLMSIGGINKFYRLGPTGNVLYNIIFVILDNAARIA